MLNKIRSKYILSKPFECITTKRFLNIIKYNKSLQKKFNLSFNSYFQIKIVVIPLQEEIKENKVFINIMNKKDENFFHIFFNGGEKEIKRNYIKPNEKVSKIKILIDKEIKSIANLFDGIDFVKKIIFRKFNRNDFTDFNSMFNGCTKLIKLDITKLKTDNVKNMKSMFSHCSSLKHFDLSKFNTEKVENMEEMFFGCESLKKINISNFKTGEVKNMKKMFCECESLNKLDLSNFITDKVDDMTSMFKSCSSLKELNLSNFKFNETTNVQLMFSGCLIELLDDIRSKFKTLSQSAFFNLDFLNMSKCDFGCPPDDICDDEDDENL